MKFRFFNLFTLFVFLIGMLAVLPSTPVYAVTNTWAVTSTGDGSANAANCPGSSCRLRDAIAAAVSGDTINFSLTYPATITLNQGELSVSQNITIAGPGSGNLTINANNASRVFIISSNTVSISGLTLTHGLANTALYGSGDYIAGGAVENYGSHLTLDQMVITANMVNCASPCNNNGANGNGGAIISLTGSSLTVTNSSITNNNATLSGGGIYFSSGIASGDILTLTNDVISGNQAMDSTAGAGGGIDIGYAQVATLTNVTVSNNIAGAAGGGLNVYSSATTITNSTFSSNQSKASSLYGGGGISNNGVGTLLLGNSTLSGNSAVLNGGGFFGNGGAATIYNSTFTGNSASGDGGGAIFNDTMLTLQNDTISSNTASSTYGGGLLTSSTMSVSLKNTILANNTGSDCYKNGAAWIANIDNLIKTNDVLHPCPSASLTSDPMLLSLANNGGPTQTMALRAGSPAIDAGDDTSCSNTPVSGKDQRGVTRPQGVHCDIGAVEGAAYPLYLPLVIR